MADFSFSNLIPGAGESNTSGTTSATPVKQTTDLDTAIAKNSGLTDDLSILATGQPAKTTVAPTPANSIAANANTSTGSQFGSSAGVTMAKNQTNASASASVATTPPTTVAPAPAYIDVSDTTSTTNTSSPAAGTTTVAPNTDQNVDPSTLTANAQDYVTTQTTSLQSELNDANTQAQSDYNSAAASASAQAQSQITTLTTQMNEAMNGARASLLAANPYASPNDPNVSGYVNAVQAQFQNQIDQVNQSLQTSLAGLQSTLNDAQSTAKSSYDSAIAGVASNARTLSDSESSTIATKQDAEQSKFFTAIKSFMPTTDLSTLSDDQIMNDPEMSAYVQMGINSGMTEDQAISILKDQTTSSAPGMDGNWNTGYDSGAVLGQTGLTYGAINNMATELNATGKMPSLGLGSSTTTKATRQAILNRAAVLNPNGAGIVAEQAYIKGATTGATRAQSLLTPASAAADKANAQIAIVKPLVDKLNFGNNFIWNSATGAFETKGEVSPDVVTAVSAMTTLVQEYGKVQSGSTGAAGLTDAARQTATDTINLYMGKESVDQVLNLMQTEMANTIQGYQDSISAQTANITAAASNGDTSGSNTALTESANNSGASGTTTTSSINDPSAWPGMPGS